MSKNGVKIVNEIDLKPRITVVAVGGAGGNAVNNMIRAKLEGVEFVVANTDAQALEQSMVEPKNRIQLGLNITQGLGAGSKPDVGRAAAEESIDDIVKRLEGSNMVFITAGMGGGTGTGAAPVIARAARESGILTVGVVTKPFHFEGTHRMRSAERGIEELHQFVDTLIIIPNQNLFRLANERTTFADAFKMADDVLYSGVRGITDLILMPGLINLDFADIRAVMAEMGKAMMGTGEAEGDRRALDAAEAAISNPLLDDVSMKGAKAVLINITGGYDMTLYEMDEAANRIREDVETEANIIFGSSFDEKLNGRMRVSVVATGIGQATVASNRKAAATTAHHTQADTTPQTTTSASSHGMSMMNSSYGSIASTASESARTQTTTNGYEHMRAETPTMGNTPSHPQMPTAAPFGTPSYQDSNPHPMSHPSTIEKDHFAPETENTTLQHHPATTSMMGTSSTSESDYGMNTDGAREFTQRTLPFGQGAQPNMQASLTPAQTEPRKKSPSLFERFTGSRKNQTQPVVEPVVKQEQQSPHDDQVDFLDIPAFLRRNNS